MRFSVYAALLLSVALALAMPGLTRRLEPALRAKTLTASAVIAAATSTWALLLLAMALLTDTPIAEERRTVHPVPAIVSVAAVVLLTLVTHRAARVAQVRLGSARDLQRICALCNPSGELVVLSDPVPQAFAVAGRPGRILISSGLLRLTDPPELRVVLEHERAHLRHAHHRLRGLNELAAALNPLLRTSRDLVAFTVERWADEAAAERVGDRQLAARALAKVALAGAGSAPAASLAFHRNAVPARVKALQSPAVPSWPLLAVAALLPATLTAIVAGDATLAFARVAERLVS